MKTLTKIIDKTLEKYPFIEANYKKIVKNLYEKNLGVAYDKPIKVEKILKPIQ
jgi:hypothetical protein